MNEVDSYLANLGSVLNLGKLDLKVGFAPHQSSSCGRGQRSTDDFQIYTSLPQRLETTYLTVKPNLMCIFI